MTTTSLRATATAFAATMILAGAAQAATVTNALSAGQIFGVLPADNIITAEGDTDATFVFDVLEDLFIDQFSVTVNTFTPLPPDLSYSVTVGGATSGAAFDPARIEVQQQGSSTATAIFPTGGGFPFGPVAAGAGNLVVSVTGAGAFTTGTDVDLRFRTAEQNFNVVPLPAAGLLLLGGLGGLGGLALVARRRRG